MQFHYQSNKQTYVQYIGSPFSEYAQNPQHLMDLLTGLSANIYHQNACHNNIVIPLHLHASYLASVMTYQNEKLDYHRETTRREILSTAAQWYKKLKKKFSYHRGTARCALLVNLCCISRAMGVIKVSNSKSDLQGHSRALAMVPFDRPHTIS